MVAISQSGESTDTNLVLERAREQGALTVGITNEPDSSLAQLAEHVFLVRAGKREERRRHQDLHRPVAALYLLAYALGGADPHSTIWSAFRIGRRRRWNWRRRSRRARSATASWSTRWWWGAG